MLFEETLRFGGDAEEVWKRASAVKEIPNYWHGTRSLEVVDEMEDVVHVRVKFAFGGAGEADIVTEGEKKTMVIDYRSGPFTGKQTVTVSEGSVTARWDVKFKGVFRLASRWNEKHFKSGTTHALQRLVGSQSSPEWSDGQLTR